MRLPWRKKLQLTRVLAAQPGGPTYMLYFAVTAQSIKEVENSILERI